MLKCYNSTRFTTHYYCYLNNDIFIIYFKKEETTVTLVDKKDKVSNLITNKYRGKEITDQLLLLKLKYLVSDYLLNTITNYSNSIKQLTELHKQLNL